MIVMPRRSVTRFFIPLIDVLILLFCIFLLMPFVKSAGEEGEGGTAPAPAVEPVNTGDSQEMARQITALRREVEQLKEERRQVVQQLFVRPLEIDQQSGELFYFAGRERVQIRNEADATRLIEQDRRQVRGSGREAYYLLLYPRDESPFPTQRQIREYERWFQGVAHGFDNPLGQP